MYTLTSFIYLSCCGKLQFQFYSLFSYFSIKFQHESKILDFINLVTPYFYFLLETTIHCERENTLCQKSVSPFFLETFLNRAETNMSDIR